MKALKWHALVSVLNRRSTHNKLTWNLKPAALLA